MIVHDKRLRPARTMPHMNPTNSKGFRISTGSPVPEVTKLPEIVEVQPLAALSRRPSWHVPLSDPKT
jgi:hypothetical protein